MIMISMSLPSSLLPWSTCSCVKGEYACLFVCVCVECLQETKEGI